MKFLKVDSEPGKIKAILLSALLFVAGLSYYQYVAIERTVENTKQRTIPTLSKIGNRFNAILSERERKGDNEEQPEIILWKDLKASGRRFLEALALFSIPILIGLNMGALPHVRCVFKLPVLVFGAIPPFSLMAIFLVAFGTDELAKIMLMFAGCFPTIVVDVYNRAAAVPKEYKVQAFTMGATDFEVVYSRILPMIMPHIMNTVRLNLRPLIIFLLASETLAAEAGMGHRIFLVWRFMHMDTILVYVFIMSIMISAIDYGIQWWITFRYPWFERNGGG